MRLGIFILESLTDGMTGGIEGLTVGCARTTPSSLGVGSNSVESSLSLRVVSPVSVDGRGSSMVILDKSKVG